MGNSFGESPLKLLTDAYESANNVSRTIPVLLRLPLFFYGFVVHSIERFAQKYVFVMSSWLFEIAIIVKWIN